MENKKRKTNKGFTLVEVLVATFIFSSIVVTAIGSLLATLNSSKNARAMRIAMDNVNYAMESMARTIRMGENYICSDTEVTMVGNPSTQDCPNGNSFIAVEPQDMGNEEKRVGFTTGLRQDGTYTLLKYLGVDSTEIVSSDVNIEKLKFFVTGSDPLPDSDQAKVRIIMKGAVKVKDSWVSFALQTLVSQRNY